MATTDIATTITRTNVGSDGAGIILGTITIEIMSGTTTGIDAARVFLPIMDLLEEAL